ncbi:MAG: SUMF1/EgtB/PvdO family nonheme iron enzyme [Myxococcaceae bacterium]|nr:SUMF1/EgtB/PvdO family nonheme iron enzyme [Myxococcaceae bacterium]
MLSGCSEEDTNKSAPSTQTTVLEVGDENCPNGGVKIEVLIDGVVQESETQYVCHGSSDNQNNQGEQGDQNDQNDQGDQGEQGDDTCANNIKPEIAIELDVALVYQAGKAYFLTVSANKAGLNYQIEAPMMNVELAEAEINVDGKYIIKYTVTPEAGAENAVITASDSCEESVSKEFTMTAVASKEIAAVKIPAGSFNSSVPDAANPVNINTFIIAKTETTVEQFKACVEAGVCSSSNLNYVTFIENSLCNYDRGEEWLSHPMNCVSWQGASEYCAWIGGRLPTEDEWQYAATHNGTQALETTYPWGNDAPTHCVHAMYIDESSEVSQVCNGTTVIALSERVGTAPVGTYSAGDSPLGLQDMSGNVYEWTNSVRDLDDAEILRVVKGGAWNYSLLELSVSHRESAVPISTLPPWGFRCVASMK